AIRVSCGVSWIAGGWLRGTRCLVVCWPATGLYWCVFFFQAEDGIRDGHVTGVQTCALPISRSTRRSEATPSASPGGRASAFCERSEERRVGKECRSRRFLQSEERNTKPGGASIWGRELR